MSSILRQATHAGSWYSARASKLEKELDSFLMSAADKKEDEHIVALISPHAGYSYSGRTAAFVYKRIATNSIKRVFLLGPSHHHYSETCMLSTASGYQSPFGNIQLDLEVIGELKSSGLFKMMSLEIDEAEHSLEMCSTFLAHVMRDVNFKLIPIMVGGTSFETEKAFGEILSPYFDDPETLFVISSDFCHWGRRFGYTYHNKTWGTPHESIRELDRLGMEAVSSLDPLRFREYLREYKNTICGRHPIGILLQILKFSKHSYKVEWADYRNSEAVQSSADSSVSYAAGIVSIDRIGSAS
uniref:Protein MEMO1 isoform X1 n=1 Tax=Hirondellea gigas TaxID=1518452 RepID=A0A6A7GB68_9CRUS